MEGNDSGTGNGFAPPASFERRPGMPSPTSSVKEDAKIAANDLKSNEDSAILGPTRTRVENEDNTLHALPKAKNKKSYSFVTEELIDDDSVNDKVEENESEHKSAGRTQDQD